jgi:hypothetical protein
MLAQLGIPFMTGLTITAETLGWQGARKWLLPLGGVALLTGYFFAIDLNTPHGDLPHIIRYVSLQAIAHLFVSVAPYLGRRSVQDFWEYNKQLFANFAMGAVYTLIIVLALCFALLAVDQLFDLKLHSKPYSYLIVIVTGLFQTFYFLFHFPDHFEFQEDEGTYNAVFKNLCKFIFIPVVGLYFLILYAYSAKILINWSLPHGWVGSLVLGFSTAGIFTYLINYMLPKYDDSVLVSGFRRWFWWILTPMMALFFVAIGHRINDYGVTVERFLVAHTGVWLGLCCVYFMFSRVDNIKFIPISLGLFAFAFAFGPFNAYDVSQRSQAKELEHLLTIYNRFENGKIKSDTLTIPAEDQGRIRSIVYYLGRQGGLRAIKDWLPVSLDSFASEHKEFGMENGVFSLVFPKGSKSIQIEKKSHSYSHKSGYDEIDQIEVAGYRKVFRFTTTSDEKTPPEAGFVFRISADGGSLEQWEVVKGKEVMRGAWKLKPFFDRIGYGDNKSSYIDVPTEKRTFNLSDQVRIVLSEAQVFDKGDMLNVGMLKGYLLVK